MSYIQFVREDKNKNFEDLIKRRPTAFVLLALVAKRARWHTSSNFDDLEVGEALVGDYETYGVTRQVYRTDMEFLLKFKFLTTKPTNKGTIVKLVDTSIFDINNQPTNHQPNTQSTSNQPTANHQATTNKKDKRIKGKKDKHITPQEEKVLEIFNRVQEREGKDKFKSPKGFGSNLVYWLEDYSLEDIERAVLASRKDSYWQDILTPTILLRQKNERKEPVDYIGDLKSRGASKRRQGLRPSETYGPDGSIRKKGGGNK